MMGRGLEEDETGRARDAGAKEQHVRRELERIPAAEIAHVCARSVDCLHVRAVRPRQFSCPGLWRRIAEGMHALRRSALSSCKYAADGVCGKTLWERSSTMLRAAFVRI